ncbi:MAG: decaprenyl-phosphate phosphoribosyltransferase [Armatimonadota bacterium]
MQILWDVISLGRPRQWTKNLIVFAAIIFAGRFTDPESLLQTVIAFAAFCLLSSATYMLNDTLDFERDRRHPEKRNRPVAAGRIPVWEGYLLAVVTALFALTVSWFVSPVGLGFLWVALLYLALTTSYSIWLKHIVILDVLAISFGYVLRAVAGAVAINVEISPWLIICTLLVTLFVALAKRRAEIANMEDEAENHRAALEHYSLDLLDQMVAVVTASTVVSYCLYTVDERTLQVVGTDKLVYTVPFVLYGIFRYLYLMHEKKLGGEPEKVLFSDGPMVATMLLYAASVIVILYLF